MPCRPTIRRWRIPLLRHRTLAAIAQATQSERRHDLGADYAVGQRLAPETGYPSSMAKNTLRRYAPKVGAVCGKAARTVLCGGRSAMSVPTAIAALAMTSRRLAVLGEIGELAQDFGSAGQALFRCLPFLEKHHLHVGPYLRRLAMLANEIDQPVRLRELVVAECDHHALRAGVDLLDIGAAAIAFDRGDLEEIAHLVRQHAEAITQFGGEIVDLVVGVEIGQPTVQR